MPMTLGPSGRVTTTGAGCGLAAATGAADDEEARYQAAADQRFRQAQIRDDPASASNSLRVKGDKLYAQLKELTTPGVLNTLVPRMVNCYSQALAAAATPLERCAAARSLAEVALRRLELPLDVDGPEALELQAEALRHYVIALLAGRDCQTISCMDALYSAATGLVDRAKDWEACELVRRRPRLAEGWPELGEVLRRLHAVLPLDLGSTASCAHVATLTAWLALTRATHLYAEAASIQDEGVSEQQWRWGLSLVGDIRPLLESALTNARLLNADSLVEEAEDKLLSLNICEHICLSTQARHTADAMLQDALSNSEELDMECVRLVADKYLEAIGLASDFDQEATARAYAALGRLYCSVLRMTDRGTHYYSLALHLAHSMAPKVVSHTAWYAEAAAALQKAQDGVRLEEERQAAQERAPFVAELSAELEALQAAADRGTRALLLHVYASHPVTGSEPIVLTEDELRGDRLKDALRKAIVLYHPDRHASKPKRWQVLVQEITKYLSGRYQSFK
ncbi:hypothetical protein CHLRE_16g656900v5 [Chlamydomonas reinhardtii]|uniref:J domain-containing protein n=1 Tax=Chlamydomonas reinhardtii TaxID=3055 RepID=A0A2K3CTB0_CHLRE|nr:uncharacterized protein CHLRE_16g656900v5 [Chlamydomonas reinhardtii]PNW71501.1 hypothetical protein CHLRE_16g656900v5 [Chlamydomonas reinhardtii]